MRRHIAVILLSGCIAAGLTARAQESDGLTTDPTAKLSEEVASNTKKTNEQMASLEQRLKALEKKSGEMAKKLGTGFSSTSFEQRLKDLERRLTKIERDLDQLKGRVSKVESKK